MEQAEHVGVLRSTRGNGPTLLARFSAHKKALGAVLHAGLSRGHRANPMHSTRVEKLYATPVLFSGLATLVLSKDEVNLIEKHYLETIRQLLRLYEKTPRSVVYFLAGSLPGTALLHLRQLGLFGMICRLPSNVLHQHARDYFSSVISFKGSWFHQIRTLCVTYHLPHPLDLLESSYTKDAFKSMIKSKIYDYWEVCLRNEASELPSLLYFNPNFMTLKMPHPIWITAEHSSYKVAMATIQARMLSGRYRCGKLTRYWTNSNGSCKLTPDCQETLEDIPHILQQCPALNVLRRNLISFTFKISSNLPLKIRNLLRLRCTPEHPLFCNFILDCSNDSDVIRLVQEFGTFVLNTIFDITRVWIYTIHRERLKMLGSWHGAGY